MAEFVPSKKEASDFNNGVEYVNGDGIQAETINNLVESALYTQNAAESAKDLVNSVVEGAYAPPLVGMHHIQYEGEPTPAEIWAGTTWEIDIAYGQRFIWGADTASSLGTVGGTSTHAHGSGTLMTLFSLSTAMNQLHYKLQNGGIWTADINRTVSLATVAGTFDATEGVALAGTTGSTQFMPPYKAVLFWKRTA